MKREKMKRAVALFLCSITLFSFAACGGNGGNSSGNAGSSGNSSGADVPTPPQSSASEPATSGKYLDSLQAPSNKRALCLGTASSSGTWYIIGGAMGNSVNTHSDWFSITCEASSGGGENLRNLQDGVIDLAMLNCDMGYFFYTSTDSYEGAGSDQLRSLFAMPSASMHIVAREDSNINSIADIKGKRVAVGLAGSGYESFASKIIANAGLTYDDMTVQMINPSQMPEALQNNQVDVFFFPVNTPGSSITELALNTDIKLIGLDDSFIDQYQSSYVGYIENTIPAGTYNGQDEEVKTLATGQFACTLADSLTEDEVYVLMCDIFDNRDEWLGAHYTTQEINYDNLASLIVPLHSGAYRYLVENGVSVPDELIPPEAK